MSAFEEGMECAPLKPLTGLERQVLADLVDGRDPWRHHRGSASRPISQAVSRLKRKGYVVQAESNAPTSIGTSTIRAWRGCP